MSRDLPAVTSSLPRDLQQFVQRVREALDAGGDDAIVTARQLIIAGLASTNSAGNLTTAVDNTIQNPSAPTSLSTSGATANIIVSWNAPTYSGHAYTEIWAHTADTLGSAQLVGMTAGNSFAHNLGATATRYYWARNINRNGLASPYNAVSGVQGATSSSPNFLMELLVEAYGTNSQSPFFQLDSTTTINGVSVPAGTYMKNAHIYNAAITNAMIANAAVDSAKIADATIVNAKINDGTIETAKIKDANITTAKINDAAITTAKINDAAITTAKINDAAITNAKIGNTIESAAYSAGTAGWKIDKTGAMEMNNATFRGTLDVANASSGSRLKITSTKIEVYDGSTLRVKIGDLS